MIRIAILGAGNVGHTLAALLGSRPAFDVKMWGRHVCKSAPLELRAFGSNGTYAFGRAMAEPSLPCAVEGAEIVVLTVPAHVRSSILERISHLLGSCALLLAWEGMGGFAESLYAFGITGPAAVGLQRSPIICRTRRPGRSVEILGVRSRVVAACVEPSDGRRVARVMERIFPFHFSFAPEYACVSLSPGNPLIHPARLFGCANVDLESVSRRKRFYGDWDDLSSEILLDLHREFASLRTALDLPKKFMRTLVDHKVSRAPAEVTHEIRSEFRLSEILLPLRMVRNRWEFDRRHRFFQEDIGEGLSHIIGVAKGRGVRLPIMEAIHGWYLRTELP